MVVPSGGAGGGSSSQIFSSNFLTARQNMCYRQVSRTVTAVLAFLALVQLTGACSTRPSPKQRPPRPQWIPDILIYRENCTADYAELFCLNGGVCFRTKVLESFIVSCECQEGWYGRRCEYRDIPDRFLDSAHRRRLETASIYGCITILVVTFCVVCMAIYVHYNRGLRRGQPLLN